LEDELMLRNMKYDENGLEMSLSGEPAKLFLRMLVDLFEQNGGENFLTMTIHNQDKKYEITIVNQNGKDTPAEKVERLQKEIEQLKDDNDRAYDILANVRDILLPLVNPIGNACGDMGACTVSNPECIKCLAEQIRGQFED
jgi:hypothetical protein